MKGKKNCTLCYGSGSYLMEGDAHRSTGVVPCYHDPDLPHPKKTKLKYPDAVKMINLMREKHGKQ